MGDEKKAPTDQERIAKLDSKMLGIRCHRIEQRLDMLDLDGEMLKDCLAHTNAMLGEHLRDRHDADIDRDDAPDVVPWRRIRRRMREWAEKRGLMSKRRNVSDARRDEGRVRPRREPVTA